MARFFITGGAGFVGSNLARRLVANKQNFVSVYDNLTSGKLLHLGDISSCKNFNFIHGDLKDQKLLAPSLKNHDIVVHLASNPDISKAATQPSIDFWEGTYLTQCVLDAMLESGTKRIWYTSGSGVYGERPGLKFSEDFGPLHPISTYGASKLAGEALICSYAHMFGFTGFALRLANIVGACQTHGVGWDFLNRLKNDPTRLRVLGDGTQTKSYIFIDDVLNAFELIDSKSRKVFDVFNIGTDDTITVQKIAETAIEVLGLTAANVAIEYTGGDRGWKGDVPKIEMNFLKAKTIGWSAKYNSTEAIRKSLTLMLNEM
jgi:UDP-glucose 4-epimerase